MRIGVLGLQGDYLEHHQVLRRLGVETVDVRLPSHLEGVDGLIIPGGESTTVGVLAERYGLIEPLRRMAEAGMPIWGTCAGMIFLAKDVGRPQPVLGLMDIRVRRNAFGRQIDSFEVDLEIPALARVGDSRPFHAVFIRAPWIEAVGPEVEALARLEDGTIVAAQQRHLLATAFHPELTDDTRFHRYFLEIVQQASRR
ncbi:MAG: pyridoxal 5'-phosphate synthase glutaminase subunit PdxT [Anaerolineae bacterium]|nr:pyridoxal 5'-phosphate synthase glutaminase subunit PdxT [Thermoflexus sp.]MDW8064918.1 pyridoxal 5'-phosphate synthase glutaminase subunit PdxT [Anaerolineae bacterium]